MENAYARIIFDRSGSAWYRIEFDVDKLYGKTGQWNGPHRDKTDAENAAYDEAKLRNLDLNWVE